MSDIADIEVDVDAQLIPHFPSFIRRRVLKGGE
jgi:hypothetical protein